MPTAKIILASASPRRIELMRQVGLEVTSVSPNVAEIPRRGEKPAALVRRLSADKGSAVAVSNRVRRLRSALIVSADTIVVSPSGRQVLGKPRNKKDASRMLRALLGKTHTVLTGYCILEVAQGRVLRKHCRVVRSRVRMRALAKDAISRYIATGEPADKAGSYAAQGIGMSLIDSIRGSYTNVVGLPMSQLLSDLEELFGVRAL